MRSPRSSPAHTCPTPGTATVGGMTKRRFYLHVGLDDGSGEVVATTMAKHAHALAELGVICPTESTEELLRAAAELLHSHRAWGYRRGDVEGAWTSIVKRSRPGRDTVVVSQPLLAAASLDQAALVLDALAGFEVHVVVSVRSPDAGSVAGDDARDLGPVLARWTAALGDPARMHVVIASDAATTTWRTVGAVIGFGTRSVPVVEGDSMMRSPVPLTASRADVGEQLARSWIDLLSQGAWDVRGDVEALLPSITTTESGDERLVEALTEVARLQRRNDALEARVDRLEARRKKLKRKLRAAS